MKFVWNILIYLQNKILLVSLPKDFRVAEFRWLDTSDKLDPKWIWWSRIYEYEVVLQSVSELGANPTSRIHNTCWGFEGVHIEFKTILDSSYITTNSDLRPSHLANTSVWDITKRPPSNWVDFFDFCLNVSAIEEVHYASHLRIIHNLLQQLKLGGYLVITFDYPGMQLRALEEFLGQKIRSGPSPITGANSARPMKVFESLRVGLLILQRVESLKQHP
jgi:hypothetical protein